MKAGGTQSGLQTCKQGQSRLWRQPGMWPKDLSWGCPRAYRRWLLEKAAHRLVPDQDAEIPKVSLWVKPGTDLLSTKVPYRLRPSVKESPKVDKPLPSIADKAVIGRHGSSDQGILVVLLSGRTHCFIPLNSWESSHLPATCGNGRKDSARGIKNHVFPTLEKYWLRSSVPSVLWHIYRLYSTPSPPPPHFMTYVLLSLALKL